MHRAWHGERGAELPCPLQASRSPGTSTCSPTQELSEPHHFGVLLRPHYIGKID